MKSRLRASEMAQRVVKELTAKSGDLNSIRGTHVVEREDRLSELFSALHMCPVECTHVCSSDVTIWIIDGNLEISSENSLGS